MKKRNLLLTELIFDILVVLLLIIPGVYNNCSISIHGNYHNTSALSFIDVAFKSVTMDTPKMVGIVFIIPLTLGMGLLALNLSNKIKVAEKRVFLMFPILNMALFILTSYLCDKYSGGSYNYYGDLRRSYLEMGMLFYVIIFLLLMALLTHCLLIVSHNEHSSCKKI